MNSVRSNNLSLKNQSVLGVLLGYKDIGIRESDFVACNPGFNQGAETLCLCVCTKRVCVCNRGLNSCTVGVYNT